MSNIADAPVKQESKCKRLLAKYREEKQVVKEQLSKILSKASL
ncbi:MAG: hypothetical protein ABS951_10235 [Solibacillus sp.]